MEGNDGRFGKAAERHPACSPVDLLTTRFLYLYHSCSWRILPRYANRLLSM